MSVVAAASKQQQQQKKRAWQSPLEEIVSQIGLEMDVAHLERMFREIRTGGDPPPVDFPESPGRRRPLRVAYQGALGSYCQEAAERAFPSLSSSSSSDFFPCTNMEEAFAVLEDRSADRAIIPAENSIDGPIDRNLDLLLRHEGVKIVGELVLPVEHCLISLRDTPLASVRRVVGHPQALSHCRGRLDALGVRVHEARSSADAARLLSGSRAAGTAVVGSKAAAKEFGLQVLERNFQDQAVNFNRYLQLGLGSGAETRPGGIRKTTVAFCLEDGVSDLFRAMWAFETRGVRILRVDHRPNRSNPLRVVGGGAYFDYVFVMDLEGSGSDLKVERALTGLKEKAGFVRVLGSYNVEV